MAEYEKLMRLVDAFLVHAQAIAEVNGTTVEQAVATSVLSSSGLAVSFVVELLRRKKIDRVTATVFAGKEMQNIERAYQEVAARGEQVHALMKLLVNGEERPEGPVQ